MVLFSNLFFFIFIKLAGVRNFERPNVERPIFRNSRIANVQSNGRSSYSIFLFTKLFHFFFNYLNTQILVFSNFNAPIFYNFSHFIFFEFLKFFQFINFLK